MGRSLRHVDAVEEDLPIGGLFEAAQHAQRGGLATSRGAEQGEELSRHDLEVDPVDSGDAVELLAEPDDRDRSTAVIRSGLCRVACAGV